MATDIFLLSWLALVGLAFGSFVNAAVWRIHHRRNLTTERSECTHCHHQLAWYDLIPVASWLWLRGRCRYCGRAISPQYPIVELAVGMLFVGSYLLWPAELGGIEWFYFGLWLTYIVMLAILFVYDLRWQLLPDIIVWPLVFLALTQVIVRALSSSAGADVALDAILALLPITGLYYVLYRISNGRWVGFGDIKLGIFIGLALGTWQLSFLTLFLANLLGILVILPGLMTGKIQRSSRIPFGPFLIAGFIIAGLFGQAIIDWYSSALYLG